MFVTLEVSHAPRSWLKAKAKANMLSTSPHAVADNHRIVLGSSQNIKGRTSPITDVLVEGRARRT